MEYKGPVFNPYLHQSLRDRTQLLINQSIVTQMYGIVLLTVVVFVMWHQMLLAQFWRWVYSVSLKCKCGCFVLSNFIFYLFGAFVKIAQKRLFPSSFLFYPSVRPSVRMELGCHWTDFSQIWYLNVFRNSVQDIQVALKPYRNNGHFTCRPIHIF